MMALFAACGDDSTKATPAASPTAGLEGPGPATPKPSAAASATASPATTAAAATATATSEPLPITAATAFFAAWLSGNVAQMNANGAPAAVTAAQTAPPGSGWVFSGCQGAAGSSFCIWVRPGERVRERVSNIQLPLLVVEFTRETLTAEQVSMEFFNLWRQGNQQGMTALSRDATVVTAAQAVQPRAAAAWSFDHCEGAAGSAFCTWKVGTATLTMRIVNIETPRLVTEFRIEG